MSDITPLSVNPNKSTSKNINDLLVYSFANESTETLGDVKPEMFFIKSCSGNYDENTNKEYNADITLGVLPSYDFQTSAAIVGEEEFTARFNHLTLSDLSDESNPRYRKDLCVLEFGKYDEVTIATIKNRITDNMRMLGLPDDSYYANINAFESEDDDGNPMTHFEIWVESFPATSTGGMVLCIDQMHVTVHVEGQKLSE